MHETDATPEGGVLATYRSSRLTTGKLTRVRIYDGYIEFDHVVDPIRHNVQCAPYDQIEQVYTSKGLFFSDLIVETRIGGVLRAPGLPKPSADAAAELILSHM